MLKSYINEKNIYIKKRFHTNNITIARIYTIKDIKLIQKQKKHIYRELIYQNTQLENIHINKLYINKDIFSKKI